MIPVCNTNTLIAIYVVLLELLNINVYIFSLFLCQNSNNMLLGVYEE